MRTIELIADARATVEDAFRAHGYTSREKRAAFFLDAIAEEIEARAAEITEIRSEWSWSDHWQTPVQFTVA